MISAFRSPRILASVLAALVLSACGGGSSVGSADPTIPVGSAKLTGQVVEVDGETTALGGITLTLIETGQMVTTESDGSFSFGSVPANGVTLSTFASERVAAMQLSLASGANANMGGEAMGHEGEEDMDHGMAGDHEDDHPGLDGHHEDCEAEDGTSTDGDGSLCDGDAHIHHAENDDEIHVQLRLRDGAIEEMHTFRRNHAEHEAEVEMEHAGADADSDMHGRLELKSRSDRERFRVRIEHASPGRDLELCVVNPEGMEESQGTRMVDASGACEWMIDTSEGGRLPFGAASVEDLEGHEMRIRDAQTDDTVLSTCAPEMAPHRSEHMGAGDELDQGRGRMSLTSHVAGVEGYVEMRHREDRDEQRVSIEMDGLAADQEVQVYLQDAPDSSTFSLLGSATADATGHAEFEMDSRSGDALPHGASHVAQLTGLELEVRDAVAGTLLLSGHAPALMHDH